MKVYVVTREDMYASCGDGCCGHAYVDKVFTSEELAKAYVVAELAKYKSFSYDIDSYEVEE
jgi:hypothetical protein